MPHPEFPIDPASSTRGRGFEVALMSSSLSLSLVTSAHNNTPLDDCSLVMMFFFAVNEFHSCNCTEKCSRFVTLTPLQAHGNVIFYEWY